MCAWVLSEEGKERGDLKGEEEPDTRGVSGIRLDVGWNVRKSCLRGQVA